MARIYMRVSTDEQDLSRQSAIVESTRADGFYVAGIFREKPEGLGSRVVRAGRKGSFGGAVATTPT